MALDPRFPRTALAAALSAFGAAAWAAPTGGEVVQGTASISQAGTTTTIQQSTARAAINWQQFGIAANESVVFQQPSASAVTLNRVLGQDASSILGSLSANGQVFLLNPNGVLFGSGAQVNVGGLVASSLGLSDADFMAGNLRFVRDGAATPGAVLNQGSLSAPGGVVALIGPDLRNAGTISAPGGAIGLAAGDAVTLTLGGSPLLGITIDQGALNAAVGNSGSLVANAGEVVLSARALGSLMQSAVNNTGVIEATGLGTAGNGRVVLSAEGGSIESDSSTPIRTSMLLASASNEATVSVQGQGKSMSVESTELGNVSIDIVDGGTLAAKAANGSISVANRATQAAAAPSGAPILTVGTVGLSSGLQATGGIVFAQFPGSGFINVTAASPITSRSGNLVVNMVGRLRVDSAIEANEISLTSTEASFTGDIRSRSHFSYTSTSSVPTAFGAGSSIDAGGRLTIAAGALDVSKSSLTSGDEIVITAPTMRLAESKLEAARSVKLQSGGDVVLSDSLFIAPTATLAAGNGAAFNPGGSIRINGPVQFSGNATLAAGLPGTGYGGSAGQEINGNNLDLQASGSLTILDALRVRSTAGDISLRAGMQPGDVLGVNVPIELANPTTGRITLEGHSVPLQPYQAGTLSIRTAGSIGSAAAPYQTSVASLALDSTEGDIHVTNARSVTVAARTGGGDIEIRTANGANQPNAVGGAGGQLTVGTVAGLTGIQTAGQGDVRLLPGNGGNGPTSLFGGLGGYVVVDSPIQAGGQLTLAGGTGGAGGSGGLGGTIRLNAPIDAGDVVITAGRGGGAVSGGLSGGGGSVSVDAPVAGHPGRRGRSDP